MTKIKAVSVRVVELFTMDGASLGLFIVESEWNGMRNLRCVHVAEGSAIEGSIVVDLAPGGDSQVFGHAFGEYRAELDVVKVSPSLADKLL